MALKEMSVPESPKLYTKKYQGLLGVDYSHDITEIDPRRTPTGLNIISDEGANPVKRLGWRVIKEPHAVINGRSMASIGKILRIVTKEGVDEYNGEYEMPDLWVISVLGVFYLHHPTDSHYSTGYNVTQLYGIPSYEDEKQLIKNCVAFSFNGNLYCMLSTEGGNPLGMYKLWDMETDLAGFTRVDQAATAYVPEVTIGLSNKGIGGTSLEPINLLTPRRKFSFSADGTSRVFYLYPEDIRNDPKNMYIIADGDYTFKAEVLEDGVWNDWTQYVTHPVSSSAVTGRGLNRDGVAEDFKLGRCWITFSTEHIPPAAVNGVDNVRITFTQFDNTQISTDPIVAQGLYKESLKDLLTAKAVGIFGHTKPDRVFLAGGVTKNKVYYSQVNDPTYFPDYNYIEVGHDDNDIIALQRVSDYLAVIKGYATFDNTMYMVKGSYLDESMYFMVVPTSSTVPAIAPQSHVNLIGEPLFLSPNGIFAITGVYASSEQTVRNRSRMIDRKLTKEENLEKACAVVWNKYYILCVNNHCYILDSRNSNREYRYDTNYQYEAYYWENIPAVAFATYKDELFFGTEDGKICKFNTDVPDNTKYCDNGREVWTEVGGEYFFSLSDVDEFGEPQASAIPCEWSTPLDDDGSPQYFKTLNKKGNLVVLLPQTRTSADVTLVKDGIKYTALERFWANIFDWSKINFAEFPFSSNITARDDFIKKKVKKYKRLQIVIRNEGMFEPFGILEIIKTYYFGNFSK